jgi:hypothetical protein
MLLVPSSSLLQYRMLNPFKHSMFLSRLHFYGSGDCPLCPVSISGQFLLVWMWFRKWNKYISDSVPIWIQFRILIQSEKKVLKRKCKTCLIVMLITKLFGIMYIQYHHKITINYTFPLSQDHIWNVLRGRFCEKSFSICNFVNQLIPFLHKFLPSF